jgi:DNA-nicking Smr family endonuclease
MPSKKPRKPAPLKVGLADLKRLTAAAANLPPIARQRLSQARTRAGSTGVSKAPGENTAITELSIEDRALFQRVAGAVQRINPRDRRAPTASPAAIARFEQLTHVPRSRPLPAPADGAAAAGDRCAHGIAADHGLSDACVSHLLRDAGTAFLRAGVGPDVLKRIAQRSWPLEADLDLHGLSVEQAWLRLASFITQCVAYEARCVRVVTGKGYGSPQAQPVLRDKVRSWLIGLAVVRAFAQASERDGGAGAIIVLLQVETRQARNRPGTRRINPA